MQEVITATHTLGRGLSVATFHFIKRRLTVKWNNCLKAWIRFVPVVLSHSQTPQTPICSTDWIQKLGYSPREFQWLVSLLQLWPHFSDSLPIPCSLAKIVLMLPFIYLFQKQRLGSQHMANARTCMVEFLVARRLQTKKRQKQFGRRTQQKGLLSGFSGACLWR